MVHNPFMPVKFSVLFRIVLCLIAVHCVSCRGESKKAEEPVPPKSIIIDAHILYETDLLQIDREYGFDGVGEVVGELEKRALAEDTKSLNRLFALFSVSDGYVTEELVVVLASIFEANPTFVLKNAYELEKERRDTLYTAILYENYSGFIREKTYPANFDEIRKLGKYSKRFVSMYEYYTTHFEHLEDWSIIPPD